MNLDETRDVPDPDPDPDPARIQGKFWIRIRPDPNEKIHRIQFLKF